jgi:hypothetical protein
MLKLYIGILQEEKEIGIEDPRRGSKGFACSPRP